MLIMRATHASGSQIEERRLETGSLTLGRSADNGWVIADPDRTLSKLHCRIDSSDGDYVLTDQSTNGVFINDSMQPIGRGRSHTLADGDAVTLGPVRLDVAITPAEGANNAGAGSGIGFDGEFDAPVTVSRPIAASAALPFSGVPHAPDSPVAPPPSEPWLQAIPGGAFGPTRHVAPQGWETPLDPADYAASGERKASHPLDAMPMDFMHEDEHIPAIATVMKLPVSQSGAQSVLPTDWNDTDPMAQATLAPSPLEALEKARPGQQAPEPSRAEPIEVPEEDMLAPPPSDRPVVLGTPSATHAAPDPGSTSSGLLDAFLAGAGLTRDAIAGASEAEIGRNLGMTMRAAVEGMRDILATRAMVKSELRVSQTVIQATDNSALKFAPDVRRCLAAMIGVPPRGFLPGPTAMADAMDDIKRHELALIAALNFVFAALTEKLDPEAIMATVRAESGIGNILPYAREARCWAVFSESYAAFQTTDAENTSGSLLAPLASAYARQLHPGGSPASLGLTSPEPRQDP